MYSLSLSDSRLTESAKSIFAGGLVGLISLVSSVSFAALIFTGPLAQFIAYGISMMLITALVSGLIVSLTSSCKNIIAIPQDRIAPILAVMSAVISALMLSQGSQIEEILLTVIATIIISTLLTGLFLFFLGIYRVGSFIRFFPLSVIGGFLAGTGWLLFLGALRVLTDLPLINWVEIEQFISPQNVEKWLAGLSVALLLCVAGRHKRQALALPLAILLAMSIFYLIVLFNGLSILELQQQGWLLGNNQNFKSLSFYHLFSIPWEKVQWDLILENLGNISSILFLSAISTLITISAIELMVKRDFDIDRELKMTGIANLVGGFMGGMVAFQSMSLTSLGLSLGGKNRLVGITATSVCGIGLLVGPEIIGLFPRPILGGLLAYMGLSFLWEWLISARKKLPFTEYLLIPFIFLVIVFSGFIEGIIIGLISAIILFVVNYSQVGAVRFNVTGKNRRSYVERHPKDQKCLKKNGRQIRIIALHGFLFFGTTRKLLSQIKKLVSESSKQKLKYIIFDFKRVTGIDYSAAINFIKIWQYADQHDFKIIFTAMNPEFQQRIFNTDSWSANKDILLFFPDIDHGLEWCEDQILKQEKCYLIEDQDSMLSGILHKMRGSSEKDLFLNYLDKLTLPAGHTLIHQGDKSDDLYFIVDGSISVYLETKSGENIRLRKTQSGTLIGELGFYLQGKRSASVKTEMDSTVYRLSTDSLKKMEQENPAIALIFHRFMAEFSARRLLSTTDVLTKVMD